MTGVFVSESQWTLPNVLGFNSLARAMVTEIFQSSRCRRFCQTASLWVTKLPAATEHSRPEGSHGWAGQLEAAPARRRKENRTLGEPEAIFPNMDHIVSNFFKNSANTHNFLGKRPWENATGGRKS